MKQLLLSPLFIGGCTVVSTMCWVVCFVWMHRINSNQNKLLLELHSQNRRLERLAREEHAMVSDLHPAVGEIKEAVEEVAKR